MRAGVDLARFMAPEAIPADAVWKQCADFDRAQQAAGSSAAA
jgi:hypothetical protein